MFEDSLLESGGRLKTKRGRTTTFAIFLEIIAIGVMVLLPLIFTEALTKQQLMTFLVAPPPPPPPPTAARRATKDCQTDSDRHREWRAADAHQDSPKDSDDQGRR